MLKIVKNYLKLPTDNVVAIVDLVIRNNKEFLLYAKNVIPLNCFEHEDSTLDIEIFRLLNKVNTSNDINNGYTIKGVKTGKFILMRNVFDNKPSYIKIFKRKGADIIFLK